MLKCTSTRLLEILHVVQKKIEQTCGETCCSSEHKHRGVFEENLKAKQASTKIDKQYAPNPFLGMLGGRRGREGIE